MSKKGFAAYRAGQVVMFKWYNQWWPGVVMETAIEEIRVRFAHTEEFM